MFSLPHFINIIAYSYPYLTINGFKYLVEFFCEWARLGKYNHCYLYLSRSKLALLCSDFKGMGAGACTMLYRSRS